MTHKCPVRNCSYDLNITEKNLVQDGTGSRAKVVRCDKGHRFFLVEDRTPKPGLNQLPTRR